VIQARSGELKADLPMDELSHLSAEEVEDLTKSEPLILGSLLRGNLDGLVQRLNRMRWANN
jgi:hypothetical protein